MLLVRFFSVYKVSTGYIEVSPLCIAYKLLKNFGSRCRRSVFSACLFDIADIKQTGGKYASAATAAKILEQFVGDAQWAHLDIAGTDFINAKKPYQEHGATGVAVRTLAEFVLRRAE